MYESLTLAGRTFTPARLLAPMAGVTHSAFRRLVADFGGYGALYSEMLWGTGLLGANLPTSPHTRVRPHEGALFYQLLLNGSENIAEICGRLTVLEPAGLDLNLGCPSPRVRRFGGGVEMFADLDRLRRTLRHLRERWSGPLTVKCRLGDGLAGWRARFLDRLKLFEDIGVDGVIVHPRYANEKLKRRVRWEEYQWIGEQTVLPTIASGDIVGPESIAERGSMRFVRGIMIGRMAIARPWVFRSFDGEEPETDLAEIWFRFVRYVREDFPARQVCGRIREFTTYFARNFVYGHQLLKRIRSARSIDEMLDGAGRFFDSPCERRLHPELAKY